MLTIRHVLAGAIGLLFAAAVEATAAANKSPIAPASTCRIVNIVAFSARPPATYWKWRSTVELVSGPSPEHPQSRGQQQDFALRLRVARRSLRAAEHEAKAWMRWLT